MSKIYQSITELVGRTPLLRLTGLEKKHGLKAELVVKLEYYNPNQSVKDRIALAMIEDAEQKGTLRKGITIVDMTSGNTGIGLAAIAAAKGYKFKTYVIDNVSVERFKTIEAFGGETIKLFSIPEVREVLEKNGPDFFAIRNALENAVLSKQKDIVFVNQTFNEANPAVHRRTTGPEIWEDTGGRIDFFVAAVGTGGTVSGAGAFLKEKNPAIRIAAVEPHPDSAPGKHNPNPEPEEIFGVHPFTYVPAAWLPGVFDTKIYDESIQVRTQEAFETARAVAKTDGVMLGTSSGAAIHAAVRIAQRPENAGKRIVAIAADNGTRYLSTNLFEE
jgi:cysteine synthase A